MTEPKQQHSESRERIISVAHTLFLERGFSDVSMQQIGDGAGITKATLYHHFRDKQDLYLETMRVAMTRGQNTMREKMSENVSLREQLRSILHYISSDQPTDLQRLAEDFQHHMDDETRRQFWQQFEKPWVLWRPAIEAAIASGELRSQNPTFVARYIYSVSVGIAQIRRVDAEVPYSNDEMIEMAVSSIMDGLASG